jgi:heterodisulfide reductase subunit A
VYVFLREVRVAGLHLEELYDRAREAGVVFVKYKNTPRFAEIEKKISISCEDVVIGGPVEIESDFLAVSAAGIKTPADSALAEMMGITLDELGQYQANNIHLFSVRTNRPGIFALGEGRGTYYLPDVITEAKNAAEEVDMAFAELRKLELSHAIVDEDKCAICLTCIRSCPHKAMFINREKGVAESSPEACQRCGICVGECPAKAITLPMYSDEIIMAHL